MRSVRAAIGNSARLSSSFQPVSAEEVPSSFCWSNSPVSSSGTSHSSIGGLASEKNQDDHFAVGLLCPLGSWLRLCGHASRGVGTVFLVEKSEKQQQKSPGVLLS